MTPLPQQQTASPSPPPLRRPALLSSLKGRLLALAAVVLGAGLLVFAVQLSAMFRQHVERAALTTLEHHLEQLVVSLRCDADGHCRTDARLADPRFTRPLSGLYWQVNDADGRYVARSRSLWDAVLPPPPAPLPRQGALHYDATGPDGERLLVLARQLLITAGHDQLTPGMSDEANTQERHSVHDGANGADNKGRLLTFMVAMNRAELEQAVVSFRRELVISLLLLGVVLLVVLVIQVWLGLRPLQRIRRQIAELRTGRRQHLDAPAVEEIRTLVEELQALLHSQQQHMEQARARAGNLAHGMKTPLAALLTLARDMAERGNPEDARAVLRHATQLRQHVEHELSRARVHGHRALHEQTRLRPVLEQLLRTLHTLHRERSLRWQVEATDDICLRMARGDLLELLGNLLDNAAKWARTQVRIAAGQDGDSIWLMVEDDGPGVPQADRQRILQRGVRLDEKVPGSGLGLAIVQEVVQAYGGTLQLDESPLGGLQVRITLPQART